MKRFAAIALALLPLTALGQDTVMLGSAYIYGVRAQSDNVAGSRTTSILPGMVGGNMSEALSEILSGQSLVSIKSMGQGGLATSSFRGTSSNHTQVNWNGININSPMLGDFDFSQVPAFFTDEIVLFHGGGYLRNGTGALGGSVNLNNHIPTEGRVRALSEYGSNDTFTEALSFTLTPGAKTGRLALRTRLYMQSSDNDFRYLNKVREINSYYERRKGAEYSQKGAMQELYYDINPKLTLSANLWFMSGDRQLPQPVLSANPAHERQRGGMLRSVASLTRKGGRSESRTSIAWLHDRMKYDYDIGGMGDIHSRNTFDSYIIKEDYSVQLSSTVRLSAAAQYRLDTADSENYGGRRQRDTFSAQAGAGWKPFEKLTLNGNVMGEANGGLLMPTFSAGGEYAFVENKLTAGASVSYNYRAPTLNDLYWHPGGNPGLAPERGFSCDATLTWMPRVGGVDLRLVASGYFMDISDWILWTREFEGRATHYWSPVNVQKVHSQGVELTAQAWAATGGVRHEAMFNYGLSKSLNRSSRSSKSYGKQLPYIPVHKWNAVYGAKTGGFALSLSASYCGERYIYTDNSQGAAGRVDGYTLLDAEAGYTFDMAGKRTLMVKLRGDNLLNTYYESTKYFPMPLRSLYIGVILNL